MPTTTAAGVQVNLLLKLRRETPVRAVAAVAVPRKTRQVRRQEIGAEIGARADAALAEGAAEAGAETGGGEAEAGVDRDGGNFSGLRIVEQFLGVQSRILCVVTSASLCDGISVAHQPQYSHVQRWHQHQHSAPKSAFSCPNAHVPSVYPPQYGISLISSSHAP